MNVIHTALLEGHDINRLVVAKLYKLNVYGEATGCAFSQFTSQVKEDFLNRTKTLLAAARCLLPLSSCLQHSTKEEILSFIMTARNGPFIRQSQPAKTSSMRLPLLHRSIVSHTHLQSLLFCRAEEAVKATFTRLLADKKILEKGGDLGFGLRHGPSQFREWPRKPHQMSPGQRRNHTKCVSSALPVDISSGHLQGRLS